MIWQSKETAVIKQLRQLINVYLSEGKHKEENGDMVVGNGYVIDT